MSETIAEWAGDAQELFHVRPTSHYRCEVHGDIGAGTLWISYDGEKTGTVCIHCAIDAIKSAGLKEPECVEPEGEDA